MEISAPLADAWFCSSTLAGMRPLTDRQAVLFRSGPSGPEITAALRVARGPLGPAGSASADDSQFVSGLSPQPEYGVSDATAHTALCISCVATTGRFGPTQLVAVVQGLPRWDSGRKVIAAR